jgi:hypothetical protein
VSSPSTHDLHDRFPQAGALSAALAGVGYLAGDQLGAALSLAAARDNGLGIALHTAGLPVGPRAGRRHPGHHAGQGGRGYKPLAREAGARQRLAQVTSTMIVWYPVAPLGSVLCFTSVWV